MLVERLKRIFIILLLALIIIGAVKLLADWQNQTKLSKEATGLSKMPVRERLEDIGGDILGKAVEILPGTPLETGGTKEEAQEIEPIEEPVKNVQNQTQILIEMIKKLPEDQLEAIKKQLYQEVCEGVLKEE